MQTDAGMESVDQTATGAENDGPGHFESPSATERSYGAELVGSLIVVFWDGDNVYYPAKVVSYENEQDKFNVLYENDDSGGLYSEDLRQSVWKIWRGSHEQMQQYFQNKGQSFFVDEPVEPPHRAASSNRKNKAPTYASMVMDAIIALNEKEGSSLNAIRKYITTNYDIIHSQRASFNNLTLKTVNKAVASGELEKIKHSFRLTALEKERREIVDEMQLAQHADEDFQPTSYPGSRKYTPFVVDPDSIHTIVHAHNKSLRKELLDFRDKRDKFLLKRLDLLKPFLPTKNYFKRILREKEKKWQYYQISLKQQMVFTPDQAPEPVDAALKAYMDEVSEDEDEEEEEEDDEAKEGNAEGKVTAASNDLETSVNHEKKIVADSSNEIEVAITTSATEAAAADVEVEESNLVYSTLEGVEMLPAPDTLHGILHEHQVTGISWMVHMYLQGMPMILGDQMGLGKTIQAIGFLAYLHEKLDKQGPHLIVVPLSVMSNWLAEIEKFCPTFRCVRFHGPQSERERIKYEEMRSLSEFDIVVTTYEILVSEVNYFRRKFVWTTVIVDEGHRLKNEKSQFSEKLRCVPCVCKVLLTGTPLQNNLRELWALLFYLAPEIFTSSEKFDGGFDLHRGKIDSSILRKARKMLSVFMLRRLKENVAIKLPSRKEVTMLVSLTDRQCELYKQLLCGLDAGTIDVVMAAAASTAATNAANSTAASSNINLLTMAEASTDVMAPAITMTKSERGRNLDSDADWRKLMNILLQLRKICNHTYLLPGIAPEPYEITEEIVAGSGKLLMLDRMLPALRADGHRVLIFSQFTSMLDLLEDYCELRDYPFVRLDGETNRVKRRLDCRRFNAKNSPLFIFLISTRAGGLGLNLASADTVILYDSDWNPQVDLQAMERAHRIGQVKPVRVFRLICRGSVEERMISRAEKKLFLNAMVAEIDPDEQLNEGSDISDVMQALGIGGSSLSKGELASLIRFGANAVFESETMAQHQMSDEELNTLLERKGRDLVDVDHTTGHSLSSAVSSSSSSAHVKANSNDGTSATSAEEDAFEAAQATLRERINTLKEVDLRQLGDFVYEKKKIGRQSFINEDLILMDDIKRDRKERIIMVNGKGTGYGGSVPILSENMIVEDLLKIDDSDQVSSKFRGRQWSHRTFCTLCARTVEDEHHHGGYHKCAHCPFVFHQRCGEDVGLFYKGSGLLICPHHRCVDCNRPTASAGGLLFRCLGCLTAYCEDCLPQDEIESVGRCRPLEKVGYISKQSYYIKCPYCCSLEGLKPQGVLGDNDVRKADEAAEEAAIIAVKSEIAARENGDAMDVVDDDNGGELKHVDTIIDNKNGNGEEEEEEAIDPLPTQLMRIAWVEIIDPPKPSRGKKRKNGRSSSGGGRKKGRGGGGGEDGDDDDDEPSAKREPVDIDIVHPDVTEECNLLDAIKIFTDHPAIVLLHEIIKEINDNAVILAAEAAAEAEQAEKNGEADTSQVKDDNVDFNYMDVDEDNSDDDEAEKKKKKRRKSVPVRTTIDVDFSAELAPVFAKVDAGRYRSISLFVKDLKFIVDGKLVSSIVKVSTSSRLQQDEARYLGKAMATFLEEMLEPKLVM